MEIIHSSNTVSTETRKQTTNGSNPQQRLTSDEYERHLAMIEADLKREASKPKVVYDSPAFKFDVVSVAHRLEFDPMATRIDDQFVYGKPLRDINGNLMKGPNGELRHADTGEVLYSKFVNKDGSKRLLRPAKRYIFYGWHAGNKEEQEKPLRFVANSDNAEIIQSCIRQTHVFDITKKADMKYSIKSIFSSDEEDGERLQEEYYREVAEEQMKTCEAGRNQ